MSATAETNVVTESPTSQQGPRPSTLNFQHGEYTSEEVGSPMQASDSGETRRAGLAAEDDCDEYGFGPHYEDCIPPDHESRTLVLCFDGTGDQFDADNSNVIQFFSMLLKDDKSKQMCYYQAGIGTYTIPEIATPAYAKFSKTVDMMLGIHLNAHVMAGYEFLMENYHCGDRICIFGFSRGAYTARALAGMIHKVGLLPAGNHQQVPFAYKMYMRDDKIGWDQSSAFKKAFSMDVDIYFLGTWDTVGSVGLVPRYLPFVKSNTHVKHYRHAMSLDEHRARFKANYWIRPGEHEQKFGVQKGEMPKSKKRSSSKNRESKPESKKETMKKLERSFSIMDPPTDVLEVWFAGCHCDVGGGNVANGTRNSMSRIPLRWMLRECFKANTGIMFHREMFHTVGMDPETLWPDVADRPPAITKWDPARPLQMPVVGAKAGSLVLPEGHDFVSEEEEDLKDILCPMYDQLKEAKGWWVLEVTPNKQRWAKDDKTLTRYLRWNWGRARLIPNQHEGVKVHRTVKMRIEAEHVLDTNGKLISGYKPKAKWDVEPIWMD